MEEFKVVKAESVLKLYHLQRKQTFANRNKADRKLPEVD